MEKMRFLTYSSMLLVCLMLAACAQTNDEMNHDTMMKDEMNHDDMQDMNDKMNDPEMDSMNDMQKHMEGMEEHMDEMMGPVKEFTVEMTDFSFSPDPITVQEGDHVKITFVALDVAHGVALPEFGVKTKRLEVGESETVEFVADKKGTYTYFCNVFCGSGHRDMKGTFIVE